MSVCLSESAAGWSLSKDCHARLLFLEPYISLARSSSTNYDFAHSLVLNLILVYLILSAWVLSTSKSSEIQRGLSLSCWFVGVDVITVAFLSLSGAGD